MRPFTDSEPVFELRTDPTSGRKVLIAEGRAARPNDFVSATSILAPSHQPADCPFCRGNESQTPHELACARDSHGNCQVRVVPNKYPVVGPDAPEVGVCENPLAIAETPLGVHEVIIESPLHVRDWLDLSVEQVAEVLGMFVGRLEFALEQPRIESALIFKNVGQGAGASLEHVHSQLVGLPFVPTLLEAELAIASRHRAMQGSCLFCDLLREELRHRQRLVCENEDFVAFCAFAGRQPYETWVLPRRHSPLFTGVSRQEIGSLASVLQQVLHRLSEIVSPLAYNLVLHTAPPRDERSEAFHWHWELIPRTASLAGLEWGTGVFINSVSPERAANILQGIKT